MRCPTLSEVPAVIDKSPDHVKISKLERKIIGHMNLASEYARMAEDAASIVDSGLMVILTEKFLANARDCSKALTDYRKLRGTMN